MLEKELKEIYGCSCGSELLEKVEKMDPEMLETLFSAAIEKGKTHAFSHLLEMGVDIQFEIGGMHAIHRAASHGRLSMVKTLLEKRCESGSARYARREDTSSI